MQLLVEHTDFRTTRTRLLGVTLLVSTVIYGLAVYYAPVFLSDSSILDDVLKSKLLTQRVADLTVLSPVTLPYLAASIILSPIYFAVCLTAFLVSNRFKHWVPPADASSRVRASLISFIIIAVLCLYGFISPLIGPTGRPYRMAHGFEWPMFLFLNTGAVFFSAVGAFQFIGCIIFRMRGLK